jgi:ubiquinone biosynthesis UbiH/UbiF/VisC/COQ6 family hydroxylase
MLTLRSSFNAYGGTSRSLYNSAAEASVVLGSNSRRPRRIRVGVVSGMLWPPQKLRTAVSGGGWGTARSFSSSSSSSSSSVATTTTDDDVYDVVIVGGGVVGATLAHQLALLGGGAQQLRIALIESGPGGGGGASSPSITASPSTDDPNYVVVPPHPRSYALSPASMALLQRTTTTTTTTSSSTSNNAEEKLNSLRWGGYYQSMQVWEAGQPASLILSTRDLLTPANDDNDNDNDDGTIETLVPFLGCCVEDAVLQQYLWNRLAQQCHSNVTLFPWTQLTNVDWNHVSTTGFVAGTLLQTPSHTKSTSSAAAAASAQLRTESTEPPPPPRRIRARLLVAADGANSALRQAAGIEMRQFDYGQTALTCTVELIMDGDATSGGTMQPTRRAFQRFLPTGPLALLPTWSPRHAVIVWSTTPHEAQQWKNNDDAAALVDHLNAQLQMGPQLVAPLATTEPADNSILSNILYGMEKLMETVQTSVTLAASGALNETDSSMGFESPPLIRNVVSPRFTFPLQCQVPLGMTMLSHSSSQHRQSTCFTMGTHLAVVGDAAHTVHPLAGQGLNLGLQDVAALVECIQRSVQAGMPIGTFLLDYEQSRRHQVGLTVAGIHAVQRLFASQSVPSKHAKALGMNFIQLMGPLRRELVQAACHGVVYN